MSSGGSPSCSPLPAAAAAAATAAATTATFRYRFATTRIPAKPSSAGVSVIEMSTASVTARAAATPIVVRNGIPATLSPTSAMMTVTAANTTADPAVATERAADSSGAMPRFSCS